MERKETNLLEVYRRYRNILFEDNSSQSNSYLSIIDEYLEKFDINSIPEEIRNEQYIDYEPIFNFVNRNNREWVLDENEEFLYESQEDVNIQSIREVFNRLKNYYHIYDKYQFEVLSPNNVSIVNVLKIPKYYEGVGIITLANVKKNVDIIIKEFAMSGYKMVREKIKTDNNNREWITLVFNPIKQEPLSTQIRRHCRYVYHSTPVDKYELIEEKGYITPQNAKRVYDYPEPRIYLYTSNPEDDDYINMMKNTTTNRQRKDRNFDGDYYLLEISTRKLPDDMQLFYDPNANNEHFVFVTLPIPITAIKEKEVVNFIKDYR